MIDSAQKRGELIGHLEAALELADELNGGRTGFLIEQARSTRRERNNSSRSRPSQLTHERVWVGLAACVLGALSYDIAYWFEGW
jgi:hypothetical protein